jgi:hypothetical protein
MSVFSRHLVVSFSLVALAACGRAPLSQFSEFEEGDAGDTAAADAGGGSEDSGAGLDIRIEDVPFADLGLDATEPGDLVEIIERDTEPQPDILEDTAPDVEPPPDVVQPPDVDGTVVIRGAVYITDPQFDTTGFTGGELPVPAAWTLLELNDGNGADLCATRTSATGTWSCTIPADATRLSILLTPNYERPMADGSLFRGRVLPNRRGEPVTGRIRLPDGATDVETILAVDEPINAALHILQTIHVGLNWTEQHGVGAGETLDIRWSAGRPFDCGSCYSDGVISLGGGVEDPDEYDDHIILHEMAHHLVNVSSRDSSPGGPHRDRLVAPVLAWSEGHAYAWAALVSGTSWYLDTFSDGVRYVDLERVTVNGVAIERPRGGLHALSDNLREEWISAIILDSFDAPSGLEAADGTQLPAEFQPRAMFDLFDSFSTSIDVGPRGIDAADWLEQMVCAFGPEARGLVEIARINALDWSGPSSDCGAP